MRDVEVHRIATPHERRTYATAPPDDATIIDGDATLIDAETGEVVGLQLCDESMPWARDLAASLGRITWQGDAEKGSEFRLSGIKNAHQTFGYSAPVPLRRRYGCSVCEFDRHHPRMTQRLEALALTSDQALRRVLPDRAKTQDELSAAIVPAWHFAQTSWTSGIINRTAALPYHRDSGNLKGSWSAMVTLRRGVSGGLLHLAPYDVYLRCANQSLTIFDGQGLLHAVTPLGGLDNLHAYRYTIVLYAKTAMRKCVSGPDEVRRAQRARSEAEDREAARLAVGDRSRSLGGHFQDRYTFKDPGPKDAA